jgi:protein ImuB
VKQNTSKKACPLKTPIEHRRYLALWLPYIAIERRRSPAQNGEQPFVLVEKQRGALRLVAVDALGLELGLRRGMALAEARARLPLLSVEDAAPEDDRRYLLALAQSCDMFSPLVAIDGDDGLLIDITGCAHLFGGEERLRGRLCRHAERWGLTPRATIAGTPEAAHALSRFSDVAIVPPGGDAQAVNPLPLAALEADPATLTALTRAGFRKLGDLAARPPPILAARFGAGIVTKLKRLCGEEVMRLTPLRQPPALLRERHFAEPITVMDQIMLALGELADELCAALEARGLGGRLFEASFFRADGKQRRLTIETAIATRDAASLTRLFTLRLDTLADPLDPGFGFDALRLSTSRVEPLGQQQRGLDGKVNDDSALAQLIDRLVTRFGRERVVRFVARDTHDPLRVAAAVPVASSSLSAPWQAGDDPLPRPLQMFHPPQPIEAMAEVPDGPPRRFRWRKVLHDVTSAEGPERIEPEWWREASSRARDYYHVEDAEGHRFWIFREGHFGAGEAGPRWFLHGLFA